MESADDGLLWIFNINLNYYMFIFFNNWNNFLKVADVTGQKNQDLSSYNLQFYVNIKTTATTCTLMISAKKKILIPRKMKNSDCCPVFTDQHLHQLLAFYFTHHNNWVPPCYKIMRIKIKLYGQLEMCLLLLNCCHTYTVEWGMSIMLTLLNLEKVPGDVQVAAALISWTGTPLTYEICL